MLDSTLRRLCAPVLDRVARDLVPAGVRAGHVTGVGFVLGIGAAGAAAASRWWLALALWLVSRLLDALDGPVARARETASLRGGFLDVVADFTVYGTFVVGVAVAVPGARLACAVLLLSYYVNGAAFLALSAAADRAGVAVDDGRRSFGFVGGLAEGTETVVVHALFCLMPGQAALIAWVFAAVVGITAAYRAWFGARILGD